MLLHSNILGEGRPLLILHGFLGMSDNWKSIGMHFAKNGFEVHLIDQRNHGRSFHSEAFSYEVLVEDLKFYCNHYQLKDVNLLGHSMGGKTAMLFAVNYPELLASLVVADISPRFYPVHHDAILAGLTALNFDQISSRKEADQQLSHYVADPGIRMFLLKNLQRIKDNTFGLRMNLKVLAEHVAEVGEALPSNTVFNKRTLFLRGDKSEYIMPADTSLIKAHFPLAEIKTISKAGHWLHAENPVDFSETVFHFLNS